MSLLRKRCAKDPARTAGQSGDLLTEHLEIGGALVTDLKNREPAKADDARRRDYDLLRQRNLIDDPLQEASSLWASYIEKVIS